MRTREDIAGDLQMRTVSGRTRADDFNHAIVEVLLDIRDLLTKQSP